MIKENSIDLSINQVTISQDHVIKRYIGPGAFHRWQTEKYILIAVANTIPVPKMLINTNEAEISIGVVPGKSCDTLMSLGNSQQLFHNIGLALRTIHQFPVQDLTGNIQGNGSALIHGDFNIYNIMFDLNMMTDICILDWEWAHLGESVEDLAWMEWSIRMNFTKFEKDLPYFYEAYGEIPDWRYRKDAMILQCNRNLEYARMIGERKTMQQWQHRAQITKRMQPF